MLHNVLTKITAPNKCVSNTTFQLPTLHEHQFRGMGIENNIENTTPYGLLLGGKKSIPEST